MAQLTNNFWGVVLVLEHAEVDEAVAIAAYGGDVAAFIGPMVPGVGTAVLGAVSLFFKGEAALIKAADKGHGVFLTMPYLAPGIVIPTTRPNPVGPPANWVAQGSGRFYTNDSADLIEYRIEPDAVGADIVDFRLEANDSRQWGKVLVLRDGLGSQWDIKIDPSEGSFSDSNSLWAHQVKNGQTLSFWKAKQFGWKNWVLDIGSLEALAPGSRVVFTWLQN
jgi:hypothetical protein